MENYLSDIQKEYNINIQNDYRDCWGSALSFIDDSKI